MFPTNEMLVMQAAAAEGGPTLDTALEVASLDSERLYQWNTMATEFSGSRPVPTL